MKTVEDLLSKLEFLARDRAAAEQGEYANNWSGFSSRIAQVRAERSFDDSVNRNFRNTLKSAAENNRINADTETIIAELCEFDKSGRPWRCGLLREFKDAYTDEQFLVERDHQPQSLHRAISVQIFFRQDGRPNNWPFDIELVCQRATLPEMGQSVVVNRAEVRINWDTAGFGDTHASRAKERMNSLSIQAEALEKSGIDVMVFGDDTAPAWELAHKKGESLGIVSLDRICELSDIEDGLAVTITLTVYDKDFCAEDTSPEINVVANDAETQMDEPPSITRPDGAPLGANKKKILQAIALRSMKQGLEQQGTGSACLAQDCVRFKKR